MDKWPLVFALCVLIVFLLVRYRAGIFTLSPSFDELDRQPVRSPFERYYPEISPDGAALCEAVVALSDAYEEIKVGTETASFYSHFGGMASLVVWVSVGGYSVAFVEYEVKNNDDVACSEHDRVNWDKLTRSAMFTYEKHFLGEPVIYEPVLWEAIRPALLAKHQELLPIQAEIRERETTRIVAEREKLYQNLRA